jgi:hypothetical protein
MEGATVVLTCGSKSFETFSDENGAFRFTDLPAGRCSLRVERGGVSRVRQILVGAGATSSEVDFWLPVQARISGRVVDRSGEAIGSGQVWLLERAMQLGAVRFRVRGSAAIASDGSYHLDRVEARRSFVLLAVAAGQTASQSVLTPAFHPGSTRLEGALPLRLEPGEIRESADIQMERVPALCAAGRVEGGSAEYRLLDQQMPAGGVAFAIGRAGKTKPDGSFQICGLPPGDYKLVAYRAASSGAGFFGREDVVLTEKDLTGIRVSTSGTTPLVASAVWSDEGQAATVPELLVKMVPMKGFAVAGLDDGLTQTCSAPCELHWPGLRLDDYRVYVSGLSGLAYLQMATYGGQNVLREPLRLGGAIEGAALKLTLDANGGRIAVHLKDRKGNPVPDVPVLVVAEREASAPAIADALIEGVTDENGSYITPGLSPERYRVVARVESADRSPDGLAALVQTMMSGRRIEVAAGSVAEVQIELR